MGEVGRNQSFISTSTPMVRDIPLHLNNIINETCTRSVMYSEQFVRNIALMTHILYCVHNHALLIGYVTLYHLVTHVILSLYRVRALLFLVLCVLIIISHIYRNLLLAS